MEVTTKQRNDGSIVFEFNSGASHIAITLMNDGGVGISSNVKISKPEDKDAESYNDAIDGMESLLMGLVGEGFDLSGEKGFNAIQTALDGIGNAF